MLSSIQYRLLFQFLPHTGAASYWKCVEHFGSIDCAFEQATDTLAPALNPDAISLIKELEAKKTVSILYQKIIQEQDACAATDVVLIADNDPRYPPLLRQAKRCPPLLYVRGNVEALSYPQIAVVGSRLPSPIGQELAFQFSQQLADAGFSITSGLALGIDGYAHRGAMASDAQSISTTIAVLGSGLNNIYPKRNRRLADEIIAHGGALVSEFPLAAEALRHHFPQRNRIVSGLACGTLVVEAVLKSGSLITARCALQQDREVFAIPGSIRSPVSRGCNAMIKSGAKLVESPNDIICELESLVSYQKECARAQQVTQPLKGRDTQPANKESELLAAVGFEPTSLDDIAGRVELPVDQLLPALLQLELEGRIENTGLGYIRL